MAIILDCLIILLLAGTIFYAVRLSTHIKAFRDSRKDLEKLIGELSGSIEKAENAIGGLRENAKEAGRDLQSLINEAQALSEELQIMNQSGDSLAGRLEKLVEKTGGLSKKTPVDFDLPLRGKKDVVSKGVAPSKKKSSSSFSGFSIRDSEFEADMDEAGLMDGDYEEENLPTDDFSSRAEKELYEALRKNKGRSERQNKSQNKRMTIS